MKTFIKFCCLILLTSSCKNADNKVHPRTAELLQDKDFQQYIAANIATISSLNAMGQNDEFKKLSKEEKGEAFANFVTENDSRNATEDNFFFHYQKIRKKFILTNKFTKEEIRSIVNEQVKKELSQKN